MEELTRTTRTRSKSLNTNVQELSHHLQEKGARDSCKIQTEIGGGRSRLQGCGEDTIDTHLANLSNDRRRLTKGTDDRKVELVRRARLTRELAEVQEQYARSMLEYETILKCCGCDPKFWRYA